MEIVIIAYAFLCILCIFTVVEILNRKRRNNDVFILFVLLAGMILYDFSSLQHKLLIFDIIAMIHILLYTGLSIFYANQTFPTEKNSSKNQEEVLRFYMSLTTEQKTRFIPVIKIIQHGGCDYDELLAEAVKILRREL